MTSPTTGRHLVLPADDFADSGFRLESVPCTADDFGRYDALVVSTAHREFKDPALYSKAKLIVDTRNFFPAGTLVCPVVTA